MNAYDLYKAINEDFEHTCPSGIVVTMRRISLGDYVRYGKMPSHLQAVVTKAHTDGIASISGHEQQREYFEWVICEALKFPKVTTLPEAVSDTVLPLDYLPDADQISIFQAAFSNMAQEVERLRPLSKPGKGKRSSTSTPSPSATDNGPAPSSA